MFFKKTVLVIGFWCKNCGFFGGT